jgi:tRNA pseudouridine38-40 synthase
MLWLVEVHVRNIALVIGYDGTGYYGFQTQPGGNTVQDHLEAAIRLLTGETVKLHGSGRTDAGVHARAQVAHFHTESTIPIERWSIALNTRLPNDIVVYEAREMPLDFHARRSAKLKTYRYVIQNSKFPDLFYSRTRYHDHRKLDTAAMKEALAYDADLLVLHDPLPGDELARSIHFEITGNGFLYNMVRIMAGTLIQIGQGKRRPEDMKRILEAKNRRLAGPTAEAHGLTLWRVEYD